MNAAITGGTGFLGQALIRQLQGNASTIRALVRRPEAAEQLAASGVVPITGDLTRNEGWGDLVEPGDIVYHVAAKVDTIGKLADFRAVTVEGTRNLLDQVLPNSPARVVYVSTGGVYHPSATGKAVCAERTPAAPPGYNYYGRAKLEAERLIRDRCDKANVPWTIIRVGFLYGPGCTTLIHRLTEMSHRRRLFIIGPGTNRIATLFVDDAASAIAAAGQQRVAEGRIYDIANGENVTQEQFIKAHTRILGLPDPKRHIPRWMAFSYASLADQLTRLPGVKMPVSRTTVALISADQVIDSTRIREDLGWQPEVPFKQGMEAFEAWYRTSHESAAASAAPLASSGGTR
jgi:nucleoside-diphosphate-sugar epimerase